MEDLNGTKPESDPKKSSISILQEIAVQLESPPVYDLIEMSGLPHNSCFKVQVRFVGYTATGTAGKKQLAKHCAASEMLKILKVERPDLNITLREESILVPNTTEIEGNPIGELKALCLTHEIEESFTQTNETGPTHAKVFEITCSLGPAKTVGTGKTKKIAKKEAAAKMMELLADKPEFMNPLEWLTSNFKEICIEEKPLPNHLQLRLLDCPHLRLLLDNHEFDVTLARQILKNISEEQKFSIQAMQVGVHDGWRTAVCLQLNFHKTIIIRDCGIDLETGLNNAAINALHFLKDLFKPHAAVDL